MGRKPRISLLLLASTGLFAVMIDYVLRELNQSGRKRI